MNTWAVQDAKSRFSEFLDTCMKQGPQLITKRGAEAAVLVPIAQWRRMQESKPSLKALLLDPDGPCDLPLLPRVRMKTRPPLVL
jgi:prevent-host-death family protein